MQSLHAKEESALDFYIKKAGPLTPLQVSYADAYMTIRGQLMLDMMCDAVKKTIPHYEILPKERTIDIKVFGEWHMNVKGREFYEIMFKTDTLDIVNVNYYCNVDGAGEGWTFQHTDQRGFTAENT